MCNAWRRVRGSSLVNSQPQTTRLEQALSWLAHLSHAYVLILSAILYASVTGIGLLFEGYNFDDWRHLGATPELWAGPEGRWVMDFLYRFVMQEQFLLPLQILLAFPCLYGCSYLLAKYAVGDRYHALATLLIFLIGSQHIYMSSALMFNAHIFAYPFAFVLSLLAFHTVFRTRSAGLAQKLLSALLAAQLLAFSLGIYQTYALFGLAIPVLVVALHDTYKIREEFVFLGVCFLVCVGGLLLYQLEWDLYRAAINLSTDARRFEAPTLGDGIDKLFALPAFLTRIYAGALVPAPTYFRLASVLAVLVTAGGVALAIYASFIDDTLKDRSAKLFAMARILIAAITLLVVLPVLFWFTYSETYTPGRTVAFVAYWLPAFALGLLALVLRRKISVLTQSVMVASIAALGIFAITSLISASETWIERTRIYEADKDNARAVYARVNELYSEEGRSFRVIGGVDYSDFTSGGQIGWTTLHAPNPKLGIFKGMFDVSDYIASYAISPQSCEAMPSEKASFVFEEIAYVCLESKTAFLPLTDCVTVGHDGVGSICLKDSLIYHVTPSCDDQIGAEAVVSVTYRGADGEWLGTSRFDDKETGLALSTGCYFAIRDLQAPYAAIEIGLYQFGSGMIWEERYAVEDFK